VCVKRVKCAFKRVKCAFKRVKCAFKRAKCAFKRTKCAFKRVKYSMCAVLNKLTLKALLGFIKFSLTVKQQGPTHTHTHTPSCCDPIMLQHMEAIECEIESRD
jgi:hypothetical protein